MPERGARSASPPSTPPKPGKPMAGNRGKTCPRWCWARRSGSNGASRNPDDDIVIDATIQRFEFTYELSWKLMKAYLEYNGNLEATSPRKAIKESFKEGLIEDGAQWLDMLQDSNRTSHTYDENCAIEIFNNIKEVYIEIFQKLIDSFEFEFHEN